MQLTPHFSLDELTLSDTAARFGIPNEADPGIVENLIKVATMLEQIRLLVGCPIIVSSGYRSPAVNKLVGGAPFSAHTLGLAADINAAKLDPRALAGLIIASDLPFDQCIFEFGRWVHVGLSMKPPRREVLTAQKQGSRTIYLKGIV